MKPCVGVVCLATPTCTGGVCESESLCLSLVIAGRGGDTVKAVAIVVVFGSVEERGDPESDMVRIVRWFSKTLSSSSSSHALKSSSINRHRDNDKVAMKLVL